MCGLCGCWCQSRRGVIWFLHCCDGPLCMPLAVLGSSAWHGNALDGLHLDGDAPLKLTLLVDLCQWRCTLRADWQLCPTVSADVDSSPSANPAARSHWCAAFMCAAWSCAVPCNSVLRTLLGIAALRSFDSRNSVVCRELQTVQFSANGGRPCAILCKRGPAVWRSPDLCAHCQYPEVDFGCSVFTSTNMTKGVEAFDPLIDCIALRAPDGLREGWVRAVARALLAEVYECLH